MKYAQLILVSVQIRNGVGRTNPAKEIIMTAKLLRFLIVSLVLVNTTAAQQSDGRKAQTPHVPQLIKKTTSRVRWYVFNGPDKDFVVEFPAKPERAPDYEAPSGTMRSVVLDGTSMSLLLSYIDVGYAPTSREGNQLPLTFRQTMLDQARERGWTVLRSELLRKNVYEQETWSPTKANPRLRLHYVERNIVRYGRQYILTCFSRIPERKVDLELCRRFLDSFHVIREPQPQ